MSSEKDTPKTDLPSTLHVDVVLHDEDTIAKIYNYPEGTERDEFIKCSLRIGALAISQARGEIDTANLRNESDRLLEQLQSRLSDHQHLVHHNLKQVLLQYFDPQSGQFNQRLEKLVSQDGELERVLHKQIGEDNSKLNQVLDRYFGSQSLLMKQLDPEQSEGLIARLKEIVSTQLNEQSFKVLEQFSLDNKTGALCRFLEELHERSGKHSQMMEEQIDELRKQFSLDEDDSALNRLVKNVDAAQQKITSEFSLDEEASALNRLKRELSGMISKMEERNQKFQEETKSLLEAMQVKREENKRTPKSGFDFENALGEWLDHHFRDSEDTVEKTGTKIGEMRQRKYGDFVIELGPGSRCEGSRIVIEAKNEDGYRLSKAREEIQMARKNRDADFGVFVFSKSKIPADLQQPVKRIGHDVYCVWDAEDSSTDVYLWSAMTIAKAVIVELGDRSEEDFDLNVVRQVITQIERQTSKFDKMETMVGTIRSHSEKLLNECEEIKRDLQQQIIQLQMFVKRDSGKKRNSTNKTLQLFD